MNYPACGCHSGPRCGTRAARLKLLDDIAAVVKSVSDRPKPAAAP